jgi:hypothetical protein
MRAERASNDSIVWILRRLAPALLITLAAGCGPLRRGASPAPAVLFFTNETLAEAHVYVVGGGLNARRIGTVMAGRTDTLLVPAELTARGPLNIVARLLARSARPQTGPVSIRAGEQYEVRLLPDARLISFLPAGP